MKLFLLVLGFLILFLIEIGRVYFIMPFPGSQQANTIDLAYFIQTYLGELRLVALVVMGWSLFYYLRQGTRAAKIVILAVLVLYIIVFYLFNFKFLAEKMFLQPTSVSLASVEANKIDSTKLVVGITLNGEAKAYPIVIIGYHHQVRDVVGGEPIMVTYCTVCRTGRIFSPKVDGKAETFRLVGMDHFNAMFEDSQTHSWWRQVNGEAIAGPLKGKSLEELPSEQMSLSTWIAHHPDTKILQEDSVFKNKYKAMANYDRGKSKGDLTRKDSLSWKDKSWVVGVQTAEASRAYDWNDLLAQHVINDILAGQPVAVLLETDSASFHAWNRVVGSDTLVFEFNSVQKHFVDRKTSSVWDGAGRAVAGPLAGTQLKTVQSYQEFWHSWKTFHPATTRYEGKPPANL